MPPEAVPSSQSLKVAGASVPPGITGEGCQPCKWDSWQVQSVFTMRFKQLRAERHAEAEPAPATSRQELT